MFPHSYRGKMTKNKTSFDNLIPRTSSLGPGLEAKAEVLNDVAVLNVFFRLLTVEKSQKIKSVLNLCSRTPIVEKFQIWFHLY